MKLQCRVWLFVLVPLFIAPAPNQALTLKLATVAPEGTSWMKEMRRAAAEIAERTHERVRIKYYPGGVMGNEQTVLRRMRVGQLHGGAFTAGALTSLYRDTDIYSLPFLFRSYEEVDFVRELIDPLIRDGLERAGVLVLSINETGFAYFLSRQPLRSLDDLRRTKVWLQEADVMTGTAFEITGISPVSLPLSDVFTGLQTGLVDTVAAPPMATIGLQWHTKVEYLTDVPVSYLIGVLVVDPKAFGRISPEDQAVVREVVVAAAARLDELTREGNREALEALKAQGIQFVETSSERERARWHRVGYETAARLRESALYSPELIDTIRRHLRERRSEAAANLGP